MSTLVRSPGPAPAALRDDLHHAELHRVGNELELHLDGAIEVDGEAGLGGGAGDDVPAYLFGPGLEFAK